MKKILCWASSLFLIFAVSCQKEEPVIPLNSIELNYTQLEMGLNKQAQLVATITPTEATYKDIVWNSSDPKIASVTNNGLVTTYSKEGMVFISVEHKAQNTRDVNISASCKIIVKKTGINNPNDTTNTDSPIEISPETSLVEVLSFPQESYHLYEKHEMNMRKLLTIFPNEVSEKATVQFQSSDSTVARISKSGKVLGLKSGSAVISAFANGYYTKTNLIVDPFYPMNRIQLNYTKKQIPPQDTLQLNASFFPTQPTYSELEWSSSNPDIASVNELGLVTSYKHGDAVITVTHKAVNEHDMEVSATCSLKVALFEMIFVEGGTFQMGATSEQGSDGRDFEKPDHSVSLSSFYLSKTEVTQEQYQAVMGENPSHFKGNNLPVEQVSWYDAKAFCEKYSQLTGENYVLPTEAQWEYAARGGKYKENTKYAGSDNVDEVAWYSENPHMGSTHPVATKAPNALGLYDMSGNVWEWCADWFGEYSAEAQTNPVGPETGYQRVFRSGSWDAKVNRVHVYSRGCNNPRYSENNLGFRIAMIP